jgi:hypothetical protein
MSKLALLASLLPDLVRDGPRRLHTGAASTGHAVVPAFDRRRRGVQEKLQLPSFEAATERRGGSTPQPQSRPRSGRMRPAAARPARQRRHIADRAASLGSLLGLSPADTCSVKYLAEAPLTMPITTGQWPRQTHCRAALQPLLHPHRSAADGWLESVLTSEARVLYEIAAAPPQATLPRLDLDAGYLSRILRNPTRGLISQTSPAMRARAGSMTAGQRFCSARTARGQVGLLGGCRPGRNVWLP